MTATNEARAEDPAGAAKETDASNDPVTVSAAATTTGTDTTPGPRRNRHTNALTIIIEALGALVQLVLVYACLLYTSRCV